MRGRSRLRSILVVRHRRFRQRDVAISVRTRRTFRAGVTRRHVAVGLTSGSTILARACIALPLPLPLSLAAELTTATRTTWSVAIATRIEIATRSARCSARRPKPHGAERKAIRIALRLLIVEIDALALRTLAATGILTAKTTFVLTTEPTLVRPAKAPLATMLAGSAQTDCIGVAVRLHRVEIRTPATLAGLSRGTTLTL